MTDWKVKLALTLWMLISWVNGMKFSSQLHVWKYEISCDLHSPLSLNPKTNIPLLSADLHLPLLLAVPVSFPLLLQFQPSFAQSPSESADPNYKWNRKIIGTVMSKVDNVPRLVFHQLVSYKWLHCTSQIRQWKRKWTMTRLTLFCIS